MNLQTISTANQDRLVDAVDGAMSHYNKGVDPSSSVAKAASASGFNSNYTRRLTEMFNAALTLDHLDTHRMDGVKRAGAFPLADYGKVWSEMSRKPEAAALRKAASVEIRDHSDAWISRNMDWGITKAAAAPEDPTRDQVLLERRDKTAQSKRALDEYRLGYFDAKEKMASAMARVVSEIKKVDGPDWVSFSRAAENMYPGTGSIVQAVGEKSGAVEDGLTFNGRVLNAIGIKTAYVSNPSPRDLVQALSVYGELVGCVKQAAEAYTLFKKAETDATAWLTSDKSDKIMDSVRPDYTSVPPTDFFKRLDDIKGFKNFTKLRIADPVLRAADTEDGELDRLYAETTQLNPILKKQPMALRAYMRRIIDSSPDGDSRGLDAYDIGALVSRGQLGGGTLPTKDMWVDSTPKIASTGALVGAGLGAAGGLMHSLFTDEDEEDGMPSESVTKRRLKKVLAGAGVGAGSGYILEKARPGFAAVPGDRTSGTPGSLFRSGLAAAGTRFLLGGGGGAGKGAIGRNIVTSLAVPASAMLADMGLGFIAPDNKYLPYAKDIAVGAGAGWLGRGAGSKWKAPVAGAALNTLFSSAAKYLSGGYLG